MGAALLSNPTRLTSILRRLVAGLPHLSISAKIRLLPEREATLDLVRAVLSTGIRALTVHCRTPAERPRHPAHYEWLPEIVRMSSIPVIANGDVFTPADIERVRMLTRASSVMVARGAQWNASIFRKNSPMGEMLDVREVTREYLHRAIQTDNHFSNTKYTVLQMWLDRPYSDKHLTRRLQSCRTIEELCRLFDLVHVSEDVARETNDNGEQRYLFDAQDED